jgi:hypothetical protein
VGSKDAPCLLEEGNREGRNERDKNRGGKKLEEINKYNR